MAGMLEAVTLTEADPNGSSSSKTERKKRLFVICNSCYWSASSLPTRKDDIAKCPECRGAISGFPLSADKA